VLNNASGMFARTSSPLAAPAPLAAPVPPAAPVQQQDSSGPIAEGILLPQTVSANNDGKASRPDSDE
jgi:hypothetical protein